MMRVELTFSSGKFIAYPEVKKMRFNEDNTVMFLQIPHEDYKRNEVTIFVNKLDFFETFEN